MDAMVCPGCQLRIEPIKVFERDTKSKKWWSITKCPRERCGRNIDIAECDKPGPKATKHSPNPKKPETGDDDRSYWRYGL